MDRDPNNPPDPPRPARPTPAREGAPSPRRSKGGKRKNGPPRARRRPPDADAESAPAAPEPDIEETTVEIDGAPWTVRVLGRAGGGASVAAFATAPLLLLGFSTKEPESSQPQEAEALVVGRTLAGLTPAQLEQAFRRASPRARERSVEPASKRARGPGTGSG